MTRTRTTSRTTAFVVAVALALPTLALSGCGSKGNDTAAGGGGGGGSMTAPMTQPQPQRQGMTGKQKLVMLGGAALLYYMYKRYQKQNAATSTAGANGKPQLYRSKNGGVYYRDPQTHQFTWVTAPQQQMQVDQSELQQYAPDYQQYQGQPAPPAPAGYRTQSFGQLDPSMGNMGGGGMMGGGPRGPRGPGM